MNISIDTVGLSKAKETITFLLKRSDNLDPLYREVGHYLIDEARRRIQQGGDPAWLPTQYPSNLHPTLRKSGALFDALNYGNVSFTSGGIRIGQRLPFYAAFQQRGTTTTPAAGRGSIRATSTIKKLRASAQHGDPPRRFLYIDSRNRTYINKMVRAYFTVGAE